MIVCLRAAAVASVMAVVASTSVMAQTTGTIPPQPPPYGVAPSQPPPTASQYSSNEIIDAGHHFFGSVSHGLGMVVEKAVSKWGLPNGYILGEEASGAFIGGLRYGDGTLYTRNAGDVRVFWEGPSVGFDAGADGARTMMLVYSLPQTGAIFDRFGGIKGSAYLVGGFGPQTISFWFPSAQGSACDSTRCPLYPQKRTWFSTVVMSALCQKRTFASFDHLIGAGEQRRRYVKSKFLGSFHVNK
jgi:hypothetical protein